MMDYGKLKNYFLAVSAKTLAFVDIDPTKSNQHEFNGVKALKDIFGAERKEHIPAKFLYLDDNTDYIEEGMGYLTWYDAREKHPTRSEYRLYYSSNEVMCAAAEGDSLFITRSTDNQYQIIIAQKASIICNQLMWLFGISDNTDFFIKGDISKTRVEANEAYLLELLGIEPEVSIDVENYIEIMFNKFKDGFPSTREFSEFVQSTLNIDFAVDNPDDIILECYNQEEMLFRVYEEVDIINRLEPVVNPEIKPDEVLEISKSILNRRKSRAGKALENHLRTIFTARKIKFDSQVKLAKGDKPDFLFPSEEAYRDNEFPIEKLTVLASKTTTKERWKQVLSEAKRLTNKHLFVVEPAITSQVTDAMKENHLQLIVPTKLQTTYKPEQISWLWNLNQFCDYVKNKQESNVA